MNLAKSLNSRRIRRQIGTLAVVTVTLCGAASTHAATIRAAAPGTSPLAGIQDDRMIQQDPVPRMKMLADAGARIARVDMRWDAIAPTQPANAADPNDPAYNWTTYDAVVAAARKYKVEVLFTVWGTPTWAVDTSLYRYGNMKYGTASFAPRNPADFGAFAQAAAKRYAPLGVHKWEGWNEPNVPIFLQPQFERIKGKAVAVSPKIYSGLQKAFYAGIKRSDRRSQVAGMVTSPAGDAGGLNPTRVVPMTFIRALNAKALRPPMDVVSHHPYPVRKRTNKPTPKGRSYSDLYNLNEITTAIDSTYLRGKKLWLTEYGFSTKRVPEYPIVVSFAGQATNISDAYWRTKTNRRVSMAIYYLLQDHAAWKSGLYTQAGKAKPGLAAYELPLWASGSMVYGQVRNATGRTKVTIQQRRGSRWIAGKSVKTAADGSFVLRISGRVQVRAVWSGKTRTGLKVKRTSSPVKV